MQTEAVHEVIVYTLPQLPNLCDSGGGAMFHTGSYTYVYGNQNQEKP